MPKGQSHEWPSDKVLQAALDAAGSLNAVAESMGISESTLRRHCQSRGLRVSRRRLREPTVLGSQVSREEILTQENEELRKALRGERRGEVMAERFITAIERALETTEPPAPLDFRWKPLHEGDPAHHRALLLISDAHGGERVKPAAVNGLNEYDWDIMHERHREILRGLASHIRRMPPITGLDIAIVGDNNSGANHKELEVTNQFPLAIQGIKMGYLLGDFVTKAAGMVNDVQVVSVPGNHPRLTKEPAAKDVDNNMDVVSTVLAEEITRGVSNVTWRQPEGNAIFHEIAGRLCYIFHGDGIRSSMPGVPWGGVMRRANTIQAGHTRHIDHFILGHFHQANVVDGGRIVMNGSVKGVDEWVLKQFGGGQPPTQLLLLFDEAKQRLTDTKYLTPTAGIPEVIA